MEGMQRTQQIVLNFSVEGHAQRTSSPGKSESSNESAG